MWSELAEVSMLFPNAKSNLAPRLIVFPLSKPA